MCCIHQHGFCLNIRYKYTAQDVMSLLDALRVLQVWLQYVPKRFVFGILMIYGCGILSIDANCTNMHRTCLSVTWMVDAMVDVPIFLLYSSMITHTTRFESFLTGKNHPLINDVKYIFGYLLNGQTYFSCDRDYLLE